MLLRCSSLCLIISDCTLSCLCLMVEEQITEGSLSESWWSAPVTDWDQWSWQRRASGGTLHNRQQELHPALETLSSHSSPQSPMFLIVWPLCTALKLASLYLKAIVYVDQETLQETLFQLRWKSFVHPSRIYDFILTRCSAAHAVLCQAFSGNHSSKSFHTMRIRIPFHLSYQYLLQKPGDTEDASK